METKPVTLNDYRVEIIELVFFFFSAVDISRENNLQTDSELRAVYGGMLDFETGSVNILPSPRVSPDIFHDIPGFAVTSESDDNSGKILVL